MYEVLLQTASLNKTQNYVLFGTFIEVLNRSKSK